MSFSLFFLEIHNKQLSHPRPTPSSSRPGSSSQSESSSTSAVKPRSKSCQRKDRSSSRTRSLQEMPMKLVKKLTRSRKWETKAKKKKKKLLSSTTEQSTYPHGKNKMCSLFCKNRCNKIVAIVAILIFSYTFFFFVNGT